MNIFLTVLDLVLALLLIGLIYQALAAARDRQKYPPPGKTIESSSLRLPGW